MLVVVVVLAHFGGYSLLVVGFVSDGAVYTETT